MVNVRLPVPGAEGPGAVAVAQAKWAAQVAQSNLPPVERLAYYGGLAALAVAGVVEWPVAAVAGVGVWVASRSRRIKDVFAIR